MLDPDTLGRMRHELMAGAAAAAATSGLGYADVVQETASQSTFKWVMRGEGVG